MRSTRSGATTPVTCSKTAWCSATRPTTSCSPPPSRTCRSCRTRSDRSRSRSRTSPSSSRCSRSRVRVARAALVGDRPRGQRAAVLRTRPVKDRGHAVTISRTGFTGDLGYEVLGPADNALPILDAVMEAGAPHQMRPFGDQALNILRIEAGLPLIGVEFSSSRYAFNENDWFTPDELGLGWLLKGIDDAGRPFIGRKRDPGRACERDVPLDDGRTQRRRATYDALFHAEGLVAAEGRAARRLGDDALRRQRRARRLTRRATRTRRCCRPTSVSRAFVRSYAEVGNTLHVETTVNHIYTSVPRDGHPAALLQPRAKDRDVMSDTNVTTPSSLAAATTASPTAPTSPRRG